MCKNGITSHQFHDRHILIYNTFMNHCTPARVLERDDLRV